MRILPNLLNRFTTKDKQEQDIKYVSDKEPETIEDIRKLFKASNLEKYLAKIELLVKPVIELELKPDKEENIPNECSKIGGKPSLPKDFNWPKTDQQKSMSFIAQLNISDFKKYDEAYLFPENGIISFFYYADQQAWGFSISKF